MTQPIVILCTEAEFFERAGAGLLKGVGYALGAAVVFGVFTGLFGKVIDHMTRERPDRPDVF